MNQITFRRRRLRDETPPGLPAGNGRDGFRPGVASRRTAAPIAAAAAAGLLLTLLAAPECAAAPAAITTTPVVENIRTYRYGPPHRPTNLQKISIVFWDPNPSDGDDGWPYDRGPYEYLQDQNYNGYPVADDPYDVYKLDNDWIEVWVVPALGGRIQKFVNKVTGNNEFYDNPAGFKPAPWGLLKQAPTSGNPWWIGGGGTEFGWPVDEHGFTFYKPFTVAAVLDHPGGASYVELHQYYEEDLENPPGGDPEPRFRADIRIRVYDDSAAYEVRIDCTNQSGVTQPLHFWSNSQASPGPGNINWQPGSQANLDLKFVFPPNVSYMYDHNGWNNFVGGNPGGGFGWKVVDWPVHTNPSAPSPQSRDLSLYRVYADTGTGLIGLFVPDDFSATFQGVYNLEADEGFVKVVPGEIVPGIRTGLKLFHWGSQSDEPSIYLAYSDTSDGTISSYVELMSAPNRIFHNPANLNGERAVYNPPEVDVPAGQTLSWTDTYYAPWGIGSFVHAAAEVALNLEAPSSATLGAGIPLTLGVYPVKNIVGGRVEVRIGGGFVYNSGPMNIGPGGSYTPFYDAVEPIVCADVPAGPTEITMTYVFPGGRRESVTLPITIAEAGACDLDETIGFNGGDPGWDSMHQASWGGGWSLVYPTIGGVSGGYMRTSRSVAGSNGAVEFFPVTPGTTVNVSGWIRCPEHAENYWAEFAYKLATDLSELSAANFDSDGGSWTLVQKFGADGALPNGNGDAWTEYSTAGIDVGANTWIAIGVKLGSSPNSGPEVGWDELRAWGDCPNGGAVPPCLDARRSSMEVY